MAKSKQKSPAKGPQPRDAKGRFLSFSTTGNQKSTVHSSGTGKSTLVEIPNLLDRKSVV